MKTELEKQIKFAISKYPGLTPKESEERDTLLELQKDHTRFFTEEEWNRLKFLNDLIWSYERIRNKETDDSIKSQNQGFVLATYLSNKGVMSFILAEIGNTGTKVLIRESLNFAISSTEERDRFLKKVSNLAAYFQAERFNEIEPACHDKKTLHTLKSTLHAKGLKFSDMNLLSEDLEALNEINDRYYLIERYEKG